MNQVTEHAPAARVQRFVGRVEIMAWSVCDAFVPPRVTRHTTARRRFQYSARSKRPPRSWVDRCQHKSWLEAFLEQPHSPTQPAIPLFRYCPEHDYEQLNDDGSGKGKKKSLHQMFAKECDKRPTIKYPSKGLHNPALRGIMHLMQRKASNVKLEQSSPSHANTS